MMGSVGSTAEVKAAFTHPSRPIRYLWKFQRGLFEWTLRKQPTC